MDVTALKPCDILLYKGSSFTSQLIQWGTKSPYSHVAVVVSPDIFLGIESNVGHQAGVRAFDLRKLDAAGVDAFRVKSTHAFNQGKVISFLVAHLGAKYDNLGVTMLGLMKVASFLTGFKVLKGYNKFQKEKDYFCSELVYAAFDEAGLDIVPQVDAADVTSPGDIAASEALEKLVLHE